MCVVPPETDNDFVDYLVLCLVGRLASKNSQTAVPHPSAKSVRGEVQWPSKSFRQSKPV